MQTNRCAWHQSIPLLHIRKIIVAEDEQESHDQNRDEKPVHVARAVCVRCQKCRARGLCRIPDNTLLDARQTIFEELNIAVNVTIPGCPLCIALWTRIVRRGHNATSLCCFIALQTREIIRRTGWTRNSGHADIGIIGRTGRTGWAGCAARIGNERHATGARWRGTHLFTQ
jgi:hypothetical protein